MEQDGCKTSKGKNWNEGRKTEEFIPYHLSFLKKEAELTPHAWGNFLEVCSLMISLKELCWKYIWSLNNLGNAFKNYRVLPVAHKEEQSKEHRIPSRWASADKHWALLRTDIWKEKVNIDCNLSINILWKLPKGTYSVWGRGGGWVESTCLPVIWVSADISPEFIVRDSPTTEYNAFLLLPPLLVSLLSLSSLAHPRFTPRVPKKGREAAFLPRLKTVVIRTY